MKSVDDSLFWQNLMQKRLSYNWRFVRTPLFKARKNSLHIKIRKKSLKLVKNEVEYLSKKLIIRLTLNNLWRLTSWTSKL